MGAFFQAAAPAGGLTHITETRETGTEDLVNLVPTTAADNICLNLEGGGALMLTASDGSTQGNARGANAIDLSTGPRSATEVASGQYSALVGGYGSTASGLSSWAGGGTNNHATGQYTVVLGGDRNNATSTGCGVYAGVLGTAAGLNSVVLGGQQCAASSTDCVTAGGLLNTANGTYSGCFAGLQGANSGTASVNLGGQGNVNVAASHCAMAGGQNNDISSASNHGGILGGYTASVAAKASVVLGGYMGLADHPCIAVFSGNSGSISDAERGRSQGQLVHLDQSTSDATPLTMDSIGSELVIPANTVFTYRGVATAWNSTDSTTSSWQVFGTIANVGGTTTLLVGTETVIVDNIGGGGAATLVATAVDSTTDLLRWTVTGVAAKTIRWSLSLMIARASTA